MPPMHNRGNNEKSKDFFGAFKKLFQNLKKWRILLALSLILAMLSAIFSIVSPNILSDFTDVITDGLVPETDIITKISEKVTANIKGIDYKEKYSIIMNSEDISISDKTKFISFTNGNIKIEELPNSILKVLIDDIEIEILNNDATSVIKTTTLDYKDQIGFIKTYSGITKDSSKNEIFQKMDELPKNIYNIIKPKIDMDQIKKLAILLAILYGLSALFNYIESFSMATLSNRFTQKLRTDISQKINKLPLKYFDNHETGDILSRITNDVDTIGMSMNQSFATLVTSVTLFLGSIVMMFVTNWIMASVAILASLIGFVAMILILKNSQKYFNKRQSELGKLNGYIEEMYSSYNVVKAYNGDKEAIKEFNKLNDNLFDYNRKSQFLSGIMQPIMSFIGNFGYVAVCITGAILVSKNMITFGVIVAFMIYVRLFTNPLSQMAQAMTSLQSTAAASERVFEFMDEIELIDESYKTKKLTKDKVKGEIEFKNVKFGYNKERTIIKNFNAKIKPGQKVAIVGPTGAGKTTLVNLLMKFYEISEGDILIDGTSIHDLTRENIHDLFVMVLQDTWLFEGTVADNIRFNKKDVTEKEIWDACNVIGVDHFIKTLPNGLNSIINDSDSISQGQKQLLTIIRGLIENAPLLILDEATSNVDTRTEELVQKAMDKLSSNKTSFIIAHRLSTIKNADLILVMKEGDIIESGTHDELMKKNGFYADLYNSQFEL